MTVAQIEKLGFPFVGSKMKPRLFRCTCIGDITIPDYFGIDDIHHLIYEKGIMKGRQLGELSRTNKFRELLGLKQLYDEDIDKIL